MNIDYTVFCDDDGYTPDTTSMHTWITAAYSASEKTCIDAIVHISIVDHHTIRTLNKSYRGKNSATNVLSFPYGDPLHAHDTTLGDIVLCKTVIDEEAYKRALPLHAHWAHMTVHGMLHLLGFDHVTDSDAAVMTAYERRALLQCAIDISCLDAFDMPSSTETAEKQAQCAHAS